MTAQNNCQLRFAFILGNVWNVQGTNLFVTAYRHFVIEVLNTIPSNIYHIFLSIHRQSTTAIHNFSPQQMNQ